MDDPKPGITPDMLSDEDRNRLGQLHRFAFAYLDECWGAEGPTTEGRKLLAWADRLLNPEETDASD